MKRAILLGHAMLTLLACASPRPAPPRPPPPRPAPPRPASPRPAPETSLLLEGVVTTTGGEPVADAEVALYDLDERGTPDGTLVGTARTDAAGRYAVEGRHGRHGWVRGRLTCRWTEQHTGRPASFELRGLLQGPYAVTTHDVVVPAAEPLPMTRVLVVDDDGAPVPGHRVELTSESRAPDGVETRLTECFGITGDDGRCAVPALTVGTKELVVRGPDGGDVWDWWYAIHPSIADRPEPREAFALRSVEARLVIGVTTSAAPELTLRVPDHGEVRLSGHLLDEHGAPLWGDGHALPPGTGDIETDEGDSVILLDDGSFEVLVPKANTFRRIRLVSPCFVDLPTVTCGTGLRQDVGDFRVSWAAGLLITLLDTDDGLYVRGATVQVRLTDVSAGEVPTSATDLRDGTYVYWAGRRSGRYEVAASAPGYATASTSGSLQAGREPAVLLVRMEPRTR